MAFITSIQDKVYIISGALDDSAQHIPEGTYLNAMNALRDLSNQLQTPQPAQPIPHTPPHTPTQRISPSLLQQLYNINERSDSKNVNTGIIMGCVSCVIGFIVGDILVAKFRL